MRHSIDKKKRIARLFLLIWLLDTVLPNAAHALTSGPAQPETQAFQPAGITDMVDLQSGDFKYNIPLLDIDGYPINLNYQSGVGIDDEASWVGLGWSLNTGAINRQVRGLPDDLKGEDFATEDYTKPMTTIGGRLSGKVELFGYAISGVDFSGSMGWAYGVYFNNYTGIGAEVSINPGINISKGNTTPLNAALGFGVLADSKYGTNFSPYASLSIKKESTEKETERAGLTASLGYNSRSGLKSLNLGATYSRGDQSLPSDLTFGYNTEPINPKVTTVYETRSDSYSFDGGPTGGGLFPGVGITGYRTIKEIPNMQSVRPAYGFLYADKGKDDKKALMDFIREKDGLMIPELPNLPVPVQTHDLFSYTSQGSQGQFRLYRGGTGIFFDSEADDKVTSGSIGLDVGIGGYSHSGLTVFEQSLHNTTRKWTNENNYRPFGDFQSYVASSPQEENVFFRKMGELVAQDDAQATRLGGKEVISVALDQTLAKNKFNCATYCSSNITSAIKNTKRQPATTAISYLNAKEASIGALDKMINVYAGIDDANAGNSYNSNPAPQLQIPRMGDENLPSIRKGDHISEITVTEGNGKRMVYGVPVYNTEQSEYTFALGGAYTVINQGASNNPDRKTNLTSQAIDSERPGRAKGIDEYYHKESVPPYATSYLLSAILSPDYVDRTGDGISNDDPGTWVKFNNTRLNDQYKWRSPFVNTAIYRGRLADADDDKGSVIFGSKEIWYVSSIETKTKVAYFITKNREDGLGALNWYAGGKNTAVKQKCLTQIRLYSKADMSRPLKVVKFSYDYQLCPFTPNSNAANGGKLTLKSVWFEYANVTKGANYPYKFTYNQPVVTSAGHKGAYGYMVTDRWGIYKSRNENISAALSNEEFPYSNQNRVTVDANVSLWHLSEISLPTGGTIKVNYEADDYAYVQNKRAMAMAKIEGLIREGVDETKLNKADGIKVKLPGEEDIPTGDIKDWFCRNYLNGSNYIYTKLFVKMNTATNGAGTDADYDFVPCYAEVDGVMPEPGRIVKIKFKNVTQGNVAANPIAIAAWQRLKNEYPAFAYPGYDNSANETVNLSVIIMATINAIRNISELTSSFYEKANDPQNSYAAEVNEEKSFVRLTKNDGDKIGGGVRVKSIVINDNWNTLSGTDVENASSYGQQYTYKLEDGRSSGVASYEPSIGNDENPFKEPVPYVQKIKGAISNLFELEKPFGESVFPPPGVTYSRVLVRDLVKSGSIMEVDPPMRTGFTVNEYYTTKDFPVRVKNTNIDPYHAKPKASFSFITSTSDEELIMSQGYSVELNDMNGKMKAVRIFKETVNSQGEKIPIQISATEYYYSTDKKNGEERTLDNSVKVINPDGSVQEKTLGQEIELYTDFREQESVNSGVAVNVGLDLVNFFIPALIPHFPIKVNNDYTLFRSACAFKVVQNYGILQSVVKTQDGSSITTENIAFDGQTGEALITRTQNEFKKDIYSVTIPAYWAYNGMSGAYKNLGMLIGGLTVGNDGSIINFNDQIAPGDVILDLNTKTPYWVVEQPVGNTTKKYLQDKYGRALIGSYTMELGRILRSGYRNVLDASIASYTCLNNPITAGPGSHLLFANNIDLTALKVLNANVSEFNENWLVDVPDINLIKNDGPNWNIVAGEGYSSGEAIYDGSYLISIDALKNYGGSINDDFLYRTNQNLLEPQYFYFYKPNQIPAGQPDNRPVTGYSIPSPGGITSIYINNNYWNSRGLNAAIKPEQSVLEAPNFQEMSVYGTFNISVPGRYYIGFDASLDMGVDVDCGDYTFNFCNSPKAFGWKIWPITFTTSGTHNVKVSLRKRAHNNLAKDFGAVEVYSAVNNAGDNDIINGTHNNITVLWSTKNLVNNDLPYMEVKLNGVNTPLPKYYYTDELNTPRSPCKPVLKSRNPYVYGFRGNWRLSKTKIMQGTRFYHGLTDEMVDIKNSGYIKNFWPNWYSTGIAGMPWLLNLQTSWVMTNAVTQYDKFGQQLENKDVLNRYSAAKFDFNGELPSAVASNAMKREMYSNGFEDLSFIPGTLTSLPETVVPEFVSVTGGSNIRGKVVNTTSHSGNYSLSITSPGIKLTTNTFNQRINSPPFLMLNESNRTYEKIVGVGRYPNGFEPLAKQYLFNAWIKDSQPTNKSYKGINLYLQGVSVPLKCKAIVDGWKLMEGIIDLKEYETFSDYTANDKGVKTEILITPVGTNVYLDDIRIHPLESHMKTYAYDDKALRLMAELDENCFATFYEYDSEGQLTRVKKETERGIMTLKETRSSYKKTQ